MSTKKPWAALVPRLKRDPTEIFSEQCFVTMEAGEGEAFEQVAAMGLAHTVVWGSDYPHYDCTFPGALAELNETFEGFDDDEVQQPAQRSRLHQRPPLHGPHVAPCPNDLASSAVPRSSRGIERANGVLPLAGGYERYFDTLGLDSAAVPR